MIRYAPKRLYAALLLLVLLAAYAGQKVHIYNEDHAHFSAHCGDLVPDNGAHTIIVDRCIIDDFYFFPYLDIAPTVHSFYACLLYTSLELAAGVEERDAVFARRADVVVLDALEERRGTRPLLFLVVLQRLAVNQFGLSAFEQGDVYKRQAWNSMPCRLPT